MLCPALGIVHTVSHRCSPLVRTNAWLVMSVIADNRVLRSGVHMRPGPLPFKRSLGDQLWLRASGRHGREKLVAFPGRSGDLLVSSRAVGTVWR